jgi:ribosome recycling factor
MNQWLTTQVPLFESVLQRLTGELSSVRTGRASVGIVDGIRVEAYGSMQDLKHVASVTVVDSRTVQIEPWDASVVKGIEKALQESDIGIQPAVAGKIIRLTMPTLTEENRKQWSKAVGKKAEDAQVELRKVRDEVKKDIEAQEEAGTIAEDARYRLQEELDELTKTYKGRIEALAQEKVDAIMAV